MIHLDFLKNCATLASLLVLGIGNAQVIGLIGGFDDSENAYAAFVDIATNAPTSPIMNIPSDTVYVVLGVAINNSGQALIGGRSYNPDYGTYAAFVDMATNTAASPVVNLPPASPPSDNGINGVAINNLGQGLIGGSVSPDFNAYAAFVDIATNTAGSPIMGLPSMADSQIFCVAINDLSQALVGGLDDNDAAYAAFVDIATNTAGSPIMGLPSMSQSTIYGVAINDLSQALLGGVDDSGAAYAAFVDIATNTAASPIMGLPSMPDSFIDSVAINNSGQALIGGSDDTDAAYAAFVDIETNTAGSPITNLPPPGANSYIASVAINDFGQGLVGGEDENSVGYAALVDPITNRAIPINLGFTTAESWISSVALIQKPQLQTTCLSGNSLIFANYINQSSPKTAFYFIPSICNASLQKALESAAPTRNAISLFTADNNLFSLNHGLSLHLRNHRHFKNRALSKEQQPPVAWETTMARDGLASLSELPQIELAIESSPKEDTVENSSQEETLKTIALRTPGTKTRPFTLWFEGIGAFSSQKKQSQTPGFDPKTGGFIFAFDKMATEHSLVGGGFAYTFTHVSEDGAQGHSDINQEYLFLYASWENYGMYLDGALWSAIFQTHQVRNIHLAGFDFASSSRPQGFQLSPHVEFGYDYIGSTSSSFEWIADPFVMLDWVNAWQQRYQEKGDGPLNIEQKAHYSSFLRTETGLRFYEAFSFDTWRFILEEKIGYVNKTPFGVGRVNAFIVGSPGSFTVETLSSSQNLGVAEISFIFEPMNQNYPYGSISYQGEFNGSFQSHQANLEASWDF